MDGSTETFEINDSADTSCFELNSNDVIVSDQRSMRVELSCKSLLGCTYEYDISFGCREHNDELVVDSGVCPTECVSMNCTSFTYPHVKDWTETFAAPTCETGELATIEKLHIVATKGKFELITSNSGSGSYVYMAGSTETFSTGDDDDTECFDIGNDIIVSDQTSFRIELSCKSFTTCEYLYDIVFGCKEIDLDGIQLLSDVDDTIKVSVGSQFSY